MFTRDEIYDKVWNFPTTKLTESFGMSDVGIAKLCKKLRIPKPPRGYWAKSQDRQKLMRPPLPVLDKEILIRRIILKNEPGDSSQENSTRSKLIRSKHIISPSAFLLPHDFRSAHPLVKKTRDALHDAKTGFWGPDNYGRIYPRESGCLNVYVGKGSIDRALLVMDVLIKGLETKGYSVEVTQQLQSSGTRERWVTQAIIQNERVEFYLEEPSIRAEKKLTAEDRSHGYSKLWTYTPSGNLKFMLSGYSNQQIKRWTIRDDRSIGNVLAIFADDLVEKSKEVRETRIYMERSVIEAQQRERQKLLEETRLRQLKENALAWDEIQKFRHFLDALEAAAIRKMGVVEPNSNLGIWLAWAKNYVDSNDPVELILNPKKGR